MTIDLKKLRQQQKDIAVKAGKGNKMFFKSKELSAETHMRLAPPPTNELNGNYFIEHTRWWIDGKPLLSNSSPYIGLPDVIQEEIDIALNSGEKDLIALALATKQLKNGGKVKKLKKETIYLFPFWLLDVKYDDNENVIFPIKVVDEICKVCEAKPTFFLDVNAIVCNRQYSNGTEHSLMDRVKGWNIIGSKVGTGTDTKYKAMGWSQQTEMEEKYYLPSKIPNVLEISKKMQRSQANLRSYIRKYFYGEDIVDEPVKDATPATTEAPAKEETPAAKEEKPKVKKQTVKKQTVAKQEVTKEQPIIKRTQASKELAAEEEDTRNMLDDVEKTNVVPDDIPEETPEEDADVDTTFDEDEDDGLGDLD